MAGQGGGETTFFQYEDASGTLHLTDSLQAIPAELRDKAKPIVVRELERAKGELRSKLDRNQDLPVVGNVHLPSFGFGIAVSLAAVLALKLVWGGAKLVLKLAAIAAIVAVLGGMYLGWVRNQAGLGKGDLSSPQQLIDDARRAAEAAKKKLEAEHRELKKTGSDR